MGEVLGTIKKKAKRARETAKGKRRANLKDEGIERLGWKNRKTD